MSAASTFQTDPLVMAFRDQCFPKLLTVEGLARKADTDVGRPDPGYMNWRTVAVGFFLGRGLSPEKAVEYAVRLFGSSHSTVEHASENGGDHGAGR